MVFTTNFVFLHHISYTFTVSKHVSMRGTLSMDVACVSAQLLRVRPLEEDNLCTTEGTIIYSFYGVKAVAVATNGAVCM